MSRQNPYNSLVMKKMILFIAAMLLAGTTAKATDHKHSDHQDRVTKRYHHTQPIIFIEGGVQFFVYPKGDVDFKTLRRNRSNRRTWNNNQGFNSPGGYYGYRRPYHNNVRYDYYGRLKKVGPNYISYDRYNRVRRIGTITIRYNRRGLLYQVGGLHIFYNRYNRIKYVEGNVHYDGCGYCGIDGCKITHEPYYRQGWKPKHYKHDDDDDDDHYKNRKRKKRYHDDDDDEDDD